MNGVKQGDVYMVCGVFCVYIDDLLKSLAEANVGCYIGSCFIGVLAYADDLVLLAPTATAMRRMLHICEEFANTFSVMPLSLNALLLNIDRKLTLSVPVAMFGLLYSKTSLTRTSGVRPRTSVLTNVRVIRKLKKIKATVH